MESPEFPIRKTGTSGIYVHYPFCVHKCSYCDFYSEGIGLDPSPSEKDLFEQYKRELRLRIRDSSIRSDRFDTVFFGGGTPSKASPERYSDLLLFFGQNLDLAKDSEISLECNPEDLSPEYLSGLYDAGINRVHVGIQSFLPKNLKFLDRYYDPETYPRILESLSTSPIRNFGADLIFGLPGQTEKEFYEDAESVLKAGVSHISIYALTVEKGTEYSRRVSSGVSLPPSEEMQEQVLKDLPTFLDSKGFTQYEVSNYSKPGMYSRHNMKYWTYEYYLGLGPGAHGFIPQGRYSNPRNTATYLKKSAAEKYEAPDPFDEFVLSLFRVFLPVDLNSFSEIIGDKKKVLWEKLERKAQEGKCEFRNGIFQWKKDSVLFLDSEILDLST